MRILLTNDDGIHAQGLLHLHSQLCSLGEVLVVAPLTVQSAVGHAVTFGKPLFVDELQITPQMKGLAVAGRPADCVKLALEKLWPEILGGRPDLVVAGLNAGANVGINAIYSGTCAAALEAGALGIPAIATSLLVDAWDKTRFDVAARHAREAIELCIQAGELAPGEVLSLNLPATEAECERPELVVAPMNLSPVHDRYDQRRSPRGAAYYWPTASGLDFQEVAAGSDVEEVMRGRITLTPLRHDLTRHQRLAFWSRRLG